MIIETVVFVAIFIFVCLICLVALLGWILEGKKLREANSMNISLVLDNTELVKENRKLKAKLSFYKQTVTGEKDGKV